MLRVLEKVRRAGGSGRHCNNGSACRSLENLPQVPESVPMRLDELAEILFILIKPYVSRLRMVGAIAGQSRCDDLDTLSEDTFSEGCQRHFKTYSAPGGQ